MSIWTSQNSSTVGPSVVSDSVSCLCRYEQYCSLAWPISRSQVTQARHLQVVEQLQLHCLNRLNAFIPCVCAFTYLSSSDNFHGRRVAPVILAVLVVTHASEHINILEYAEHSGHTQISGTRVRQMRGKWYIHNHNYSACGGHYHDQCGARSNYQ